MIFYIFIQATTKKKKRRSSAHSGHYAPLHSLWSFGRFGKTHCPAGDVPRWGWLRPEREAASTEHHCQLVSAQACQGWSHSVVQAGRPGLQEALLVLWR